MRHNRMVESKENLQVSRELGKKVEPVKLGNDDMLQIEVFCDSVNIKTKIQE